MLTFVEFEEIHLPFRFLDTESKAVPPREYWLPMNDIEKKYLLSITVSNESSQLLERESVNNEKLRSYSSKRKITDENVYKVLFRKRNFETLVPIFLDNDSTKVLPSVKENFPSNYVIIRQNPKKIRKFFQNLAIGKNEKIRTNFPLKNIT